MAQLRAAEKAGYSTTSAIYAHRKTDAVFDAAWSDAMEQAADRLEEEARRRAVPFSEIASLFESMPESRFRQEVMAEFIEDAGGVFRGVMGCATAPMS